MPGWLILNPEFPSVINHPWSGKCLAELSAEHKPYSLTFEGYTRCSVGVCAWGGSENGRDGKWLGEISFSEGWGAGEVPGEGKKENLIKEITYNPSTAASKQRKLAYHETCSEIESKSASPHHRKEH